MISSNLKASWDTRAWFLGLFLGNFAGLLLFCGGYPPPRRFLETAFPYTAFGYYTGDLVRSLGLVFSVLIFPALLTATAKRSYFWWGLLPIVLLMLWIVVGAEATRTSASLPDPLWALPVVALFCWIITALPVSLFRFFRHRYLSAKGIFAYPSAERPASRIGIFALFIPIAALIGLGWYNFKHPVRITGKMQSRWLSGKEVVVPLTKSGHSLYVQAQLNGQNALCKVDTGAENVEWPRGLHLSGKLTKSYGKSCDILGVCIGTQTIILPHVRIGGYEIENLPTEMSDNASGPFSPPSGPANEMPNLGNPAFVQTVLTIDYKNSLMTLHPPEYDFTRQPRKPGDRMLEMGWTSPYPVKNWRRNFYGTPSIQAVINGFSFWCTLDTGASGPEICLTKKLVARHLSLNGAKRSWALLDASNSSAQVPHLDNITVSFPCDAPVHVKPLLLKLNSLITPSLEADAVDGGGVIGVPLMEQYRITIDYPRGRVLLEPYANVVPNQKQEKPLRIPKQPGI